MKALLTTIAFFAVGYCVGAAVRKCDQHQYHKTAAGVFLAFHGCILLWIGWLAWDVLAEAYQ